LGAFPTAFAAIPAKPPSTSFPQQFGTIEQTTPFSCSGMRDKLPLRTLEFQGRADLLFRRQRIQVRIARFFMVGREMRRIPALRRPATTYQLGYRHNFLFEQRAGKGDLHAIGHWI